MGGAVEVSNHSETNSTTPHTYANSTFPIGMMLLGLAALSIGFHVAKQSNIVGCIIIGAVVGGMHWDQAMDLSRETAHAFSEIGIILVLFTAGMEVDVPGFLKMWKPAVINGVGRIGITLAIFAGLGAGTGTTTNPVQTIYFGLACTLSSTILVISALSTRGELQSMHGQIILGLMALQDVNAVLALSVMPGFDYKLKNPPAVGVTIGIVLGKLFAMLLCLFILYKFVLNRIFRIFAKTSEMLFIGTFSYCLGVAGICSLFGLAEMGAFWAGVSIAALPYRHEIETHAEPIKMFGVVMFFLMLGIDLNLTIDGLRKAVPMAAIITALTVFILLMIM
jgi:Kef-type K+ transport system membrane component KefB